MADRRQITLLEVAVVYVVFGVVGWIAAGKFAGFFGGGAIGALALGGAVWLRRKLKRVTPPPP